MGTKRSSIKEKLQALEEAKLIKANKVIVKNIPGPPGPKGLKGDKGDKGDEGLSAYELWLAQGYEGTEEDFLEYLKGETGAKPQLGVDYVVVAGPAGRDGVDADPLDASKYATIDYVDEGTWLIPPIIEWYDPVAEGGLPEDPEIGDRYGADGTGYGWTYDYIYEWDGEEWVESPPEDGWMVWALLELIFYVFFSGGWMEIGSRDFVPYEGAIYDVDLGAHTITANSLQGQAMDNIISLILVL